MVKYTGRGLVVKRPGVLSKVQMLNLVLGVGLFSLLPSFGCGERGEESEAGGGGDFYVEIERGEGFRGGEAGLRWPDSRESIRRFARMA